MPNDEITDLKTIIVSRPGIMQEALRAALATFPWLTIIASAGDGLTALNTVTVHQPALLVIDSNLLDEEVEVLLAEAKAQSPRTRCLVCVNGRGKRERLQNAGADAVIARDSSAQELRQVLLQLT